MRKREGGRKDEDEKTRLKGRIAKKGSERKIVRFGMIERIKEILEKTASITGERHTRVEKSTKKICGLRVHVKLCELDDYGRKKGRKVLAYQCVELQEAHTERYIENNNYALMGRGVEKGLETEKKKSVGIINPTSTLRV